MADNIDFDSGVSTYTLAADDIGGIHHPRHKLGFGADNSYVDVSSGNPLPVTSGGSFAVQESGGLLTEAQDINGAVSTINTATTAIQTSLAILDDWDETDRAKVNSIVGQAGVAAGAGAVGATVQRMTLASDDPAVTALQLLDNAIAGSEMQVDIVAAIPAGTNNIGDVDVLTLPNVTLAAGTNTNEVVGDVAHSAGVSGNPIVIAGVACDTDDTAPPNRVDAESDATRLATDRDGALYVRPHGPQIWSYHEDSSSALNDATVHASPGSGLSLYVETIVVSTGAATAMNIFFEEGSTKVLGPYYLEAVAGRGLVINFRPPKKITAATALTVTTSAAIAHSIDITGFVGQG